MSRKKVFISYCWEQSEWVWDRLAPCLMAGGAEVIIDIERIGAGRSVVGQMDAMQNEADAHVLVLSDDYLKSDPCQHEMKRAVALDPNFQKGVVLPVLRVDCILPRSISRPNPLYVDLRDGGVAVQWDKLLEACGATLGAEAPKWIEARDEIRRFLRRDESVNFVANGAARWKELIANLIDPFEAEFRVEGLKLVDLASPDTCARQDLVGRIIEAFGGRLEVPDKPRDMAALQRFLEGNKGGRLALKRFDLARNRADYESDFFTALRYLVMDAEKKHRLVLLIHSQNPLNTVWPIDHPVSMIDVKTVELRGRA